MYQHKKKSFRNTIYNLQQDDDSIVRIKYGICVVMCKLRLILYSKVLLFVRFIDYKMKREKKKQIKKREKKGIKKIN